MLLKNCVFIVVHVCFVAFCVATLSFFLLQVLPGDAAAVIAGIHAPQSVYEEVFTALSLDTPLFQRYVQWIHGLLNGDMGMSYVQSAAVSSLIRERFFITFNLAATAFSLSILCGFGMACISAVRARFNYMVRFFEYTMLSLPQFWIGLLLLYVFAVRIPIFPIFGIESIWSYILPGAALAIPNAAYISRVTRAGITEQMHSTHVLAAKTLGLPRHRIFLLHVLPAALLPSFAVIAVQAGYLFAGAVVVEQVFSIPGLGRLLLMAVLQRDLPLVQGIVVIFGLITPLLNAAAEVLSRIVVPRLSHSLVK